MPDFTIPDKKEVEKTIKSIYRLLFPATNSYSDTELENKSNTSEIQLLRILTGLTDRREDVTKRFFKNLDEIKDTLLKDAVFILESDPAAKQLIEVIAIYPGFFAIFCYRIAHSIAHLSVPLLPRMITEYAHKVTGIDSV